MIPALRHNLFPKYGLKQPITGMTVARGVQSYFHLSGDSTYLMETNLSTQQRPRLIKGEYFVTTSLRNHVIFGTRKVLKCALPSLC